LVATPGVAGPAAATGSGEDIRYIEAAGSSVAFAAEVAAAVIVGQGSR
jgi:hypothetical protein